MLNPTLGNDDAVVNGAGRCCSSKSAWAWVDALVEGALNGNDHYLGNVSSALEHALGRRSKCSIAWKAHMEVHTPGSATWCPFCREGALT